MQEELPQQTREVAYRQWVKLIRPRQRLACDKTVIAAALQIPCEANTSSVLPTDGVGNWTKESNPLGMAACSCPLVSHRTEARHGHSTSSFVGPGQGTTDANELRRSSPE